MTPPQPKSSPEEASQSRYEDLLDIATRLFWEHGYERTTVRMIADEMGVKSGSLYSHIRSKEEVLAKIVVSCAEEVLAEARTAVAAAGTGTEPQLRAFCHAHLKVLFERRAAVTIYFDEWRKLDDASRAEVVALRKQYEQILKRIITDGIERGDFDAVDERPVRLATLGALNWTYTWFSDDGDLTYDQLADAFADYFLAGLRASVPAA